MPGQGTWIATRIGVWVRPPTTWPSLAADLHDTVVVIAAANGRNRGGQHDKGFLQDGNMCDWCGSGSGTGDEQCAGAGYGDAAFRAFSARQLQSAQGCHRALVRGYQ